MSNDLPLESKVVTLYFPFTKNTYKIIYHLVNKEIHFY